MSKIQFIFKKSMFISHELPAKSWSNMGFKVNARLWKPSIRTWKPGKISIRLSRAPFALKCVIQICIYFIPHALFEVLPVGNGCPFWKRCYCNSNEENRSGINSLIWWKFHDTCQHYTQRTLFLVLHFHDCWINSYILQKRCFIL